MSKHILDRREFMKSAGMTAAAVVAVSGTTTILASNRAWAMTLQAFGPHEAEVLLAMTRQLYPHDGIGDIYYAEVVEALDAKAQAAPELVEQIKNGVAAFDQVKHVPFLQLSEGYQTEVLQFTTGAAENPTLTIVTLAIRQADYIADQMGGREI